MAALAALLDGGAALGDELYVAYYHGYRECMQLLLAADAANAAINQSDMGIKQTGVTRSLLC